MGGLAAIPPTSGFSPNQFFPLFLQIDYFVEAFTFAFDL